MTDTITIKTDVKAGIIVQDVVRASEPDVHDKIIRLVLDTQEEQARKALIGLGWRPPATEIQEKGAMMCHVAHGEDGSTLFEWIAKDRRFGLTIEAKIEESGWYYVNKDGTVESGELPAELLDFFRKGRCSRSISSWPFGDCGGGKGELSGVSRGEGSMLME